jgi:hypothetical protein
VCVTNVCANVAGAQRAVRGPQAPCDRELGPQPGGGYLQLGPEFLANGASESGFLNSARVFVCSL